MIDQPPSPPSAPDPVPEQIHQYIDRFGAWAKTLSEEDAKQVAFWMQAIMYAHHSNLPNVQSPSNAAH